RYPTLQVFLAQERHQSGPQSLIHLRNSRAKRPNPRLIRLEAQLAISIVAQVSVSHAVLVHLNSSTFFGELDHRQGGSSPNYPRRKQDRCQVIFCCSTS